MRHVGGIAMAVSKWVLLFLVVSITAGLSGVADRSSVSADVAEQCSTHSLLFSWSCLSEATGCPG
jgi:hypothetical protein